MESTCTNFKSFTGFGTKVLYLSGTYLKDLVTKGIKLGTIPQTTATPVPTRAIELLIKHALCARQTNDIVLRSRIFTALSQRPNCKFIAYISRHVKLGGEQALTQAGILTTKFTFADEAQVVSEFNNGLLNRAIDEFAEYAQRNGQPLQEVTIDELNANVHTQVTSICYLPDGTDREKALPIDTHIDELFDSFELGTNGKIELAPASSGRKEYKLEDGTLVLTSGSMATTTISHNNSTHYPIILGLIASDNNTLSQMNVILSTKQYLEFNVAQFYDAFDASVRTAYEIGYLANTSPGVLEQSRINIPRVEPPTPYSSVLNVRNTQDTQPQTNPGSYDTQGDNYSQGSGNTSSNKGNNNFTGRGGNKRKGGNRSSTKLQAFPFNEQELRSLITFATQALSRNVNRGFSNY